MTSRTHFDPADEDVNAYRLLTSLVVPRPIAWVSTCDAQGRGNLAPHSFFTVASGSPPVVMFSSVARKDTLRNIEATGEFVVNLASASLRDAVNDSSAPFAQGEDEAAALGVETEPSLTVAPSRVVASPASIECRLRQVVPVGQAFVVLGDVTALTVRDDVLVEGRPEISLLQPLSRLGGDEWGHPPEVFTLDRPDDPDQVRSREA